MQNFVYKISETTEYVKNYIAYFLRNLQTSRENNSRILRNFQGIDFI